MLGATMGERLLSFSWLFMWPYSELAGQGLCSGREGATEKEVA